MGIRATRCPSRSPLRSELELLELPELEPESVSEDSGFEDVRDDLASSSPPLPDLGQQV
jgi:hypothetical protein